MSSDPTKSLIIFSKSPLPGITKTRLRSVLNEEQCLSLHIALLQDTIERAKQADPRTILYLTHSCELPFPTDLEIRLQNGSDLGERMHNAFAKQLEVSGRVVIIGSDSPMLPAARIMQAFDSLHEFELVLGPSTDGGYYLIGLSVLVSEIFRNIEWGTSSVLESTLTLASKNKVKILDPFWDIDLPQDLFRLQKELSSYPASSLRHTRFWMMNNLKPL